LGSERNDIFWIVEQAGQQPSVGDDRDGVQAKLPQYGGYAARPADPDCAGCEHPIPPSRQVSSPTQAVFDGKCQEIVRCDQSNDLPCGV
jgi:hypothetical protein